MVEPTDMMRVTDGITGKAKGYDLVNLSSQSILLDVVKTIGEISSDLPAKAVLRS